MDIFQETSIRNRVKRLSRPRFRKWHHLIVKQPFAPQNRLMPVQAVIAISIKPGDAIRSMLAPETLQTQSIKGGVYSA